MPTLYRRFPVESKVDRWDFFSKNRLAFSKHHWLQSSIKHYIKFRFLNQNLMKLTKIFLVKIPPRGVTSLNVLLAASSSQVLMIGSYLGREM